MGHSTKVILVFCLGLIGWAEAQPQSILNLSVIPPETFSADDTIHVVGTFNQWALQGDNAKPMRRAKGKLVVDIPISEQPLLFNLVKNQSWSHLAATITGKSTCGFILSASQGNSKLELEVAAWMAEPVKSKAKNTLTGNIKHLLDFDMPQLGRKGDVQVYLPPDYTNDTNTRYPVLYMLDGQNVFDERTSYSNEWRVDEHLQALILQKQLPGLIVVAVPNGPRRWSEYIPWDFINTQGQVQKGQGELTLKFIKHRLKPYIDRHFNTLNQAEFTGLAGSSLGGLMAIYTAMVHGDSFGFVGAFSPSLGVKDTLGNNLLLTALAQYPKRLNTRIYLDMGKVEYGGYQQVEQLYHLLVQKSVSPPQLKLVKDDLGRHCETDWSKRFPQAIAWMLPQEN